jgi:hypothetical protein
MCSRLIDCFVIFLLINSQLVVIIIGNRDIGNTDERGAEMIIVGLVAVEMQ